MEIELRLEEEKDHKTVENLTREAFWNHYVPGCDEHLLVYNLRKTNVFIKDLDFVAIYNNQIVGNIMYAKSAIKNNDLEYTVLTFGPLSVLPEYQNRGIGGKLINHTVKLSKEMGYKGIIIYGDPEYYKRFGFKESIKYKITNKDKKYPATLLVLELYPNALNGIEGVFDEGKAYEIDKNEAEEFDKNFIKKEKGYSKSQERFKELSTSYLSL
jgi:predicted N-acetyltransferase YhbS